MNDPFSLEAARSAASHFAEFDEEEEFDLEVCGEIFRAFGLVSRTEDIALRRSVLLCVLACRRYANAWEGMGCEPLGPVPSIEAADHWLRTGQFLPDHAERCMPVSPFRQGQIVTDCDAPCLNELASAAARTAYLCRTRSGIDAALALCDMRGAEMEGLEHPDGRDFGDWLVEDGVVQAFHLRGIPDS